MMKAMAPAAAAPKVVAAAAIPTGVPTKSLPQVAAPSVNLGDRPEQRVPMSRLRARVAERLLQHAPPHSLVARLGGDEFAILLHHNDTGADTTEAQALASRLVTALSRPYQIKERRLRVGASVGIALIDGEVTHVDELLVRADIALYDAKAHGRGRAAEYTHALRERTRRRAEVEEGLRQAVRHDELSLH